MLYVDNSGAINVNKNVPIYTSLKTICFLPGDYFGLFNEKIKIS